MAKLRWAQTILRYLGLGRFRDASALWGHLGDVLLSRPSLLAATDVGADVQECDDVFLDVNRMNVSMWCEL